MSAPHDNAALARLIEHTITALRAHAQAGHSWAVLLRAPDGKCDCFSHCNSEEMLDMAAVPLLGVAAVARENDAPGLAHQCEQAAAAIGRRPALRLGSVGRSH